MVGGARAADARPARFAGELVSRAISTAPSTAPTSCSSRSASAARRRGCPTRPAARVRLHRPGDDRRRRLREGAADGADRARDRRARARARRRRTPGSSTSRIRSGSSRARCSTGATARSGSATSRSGSSAGSPSSRRRAGAHPRRPGRPQPPDVDPRRADRRRDVLPELLAEHGDELAEELDLPRRLLDELGAVPSYYLRYFYAHDEVLAEQLDGVPRAATVAEIERELLEMYRDPSLNEKPALLEQRGGAFYSEAAVGLVASLAGRHRGRPGRRRPQRRHARRAAGRRRRRGSRACRRGRPVAAAAGAARAGAARPRPARCRVRAPRRRGGRDGDASTARKALLAHPLIGQYDDGRRARGEHARGGGRS